MGKIVTCRDAGADCDFIIRGETEEEILHKAEEHARLEHNMQKISDELKEKMRQLIRDE